MTENLTATDEAATRHVLQAIREEKVPKRGGPLPVLIENFNQVIGHVPRNYQAHFRGRFRRGADALRQTLIEAERLDAEYETAWRATFDRYRRQLASEGDSDASTCERLARLLADGELADQHYECQMARERVRARGRDLGDVIEDAAHVTVFGSPIDAPPRLTNHVSRRTIRLTRPRERRGGCNTRSRRRAATRSSSRGGDSGDPDLGDEPPSHSRSLIGGRR
jgi:hypothetical protein